MDVYAFPKLEGRRRRAARCSEEEGANDSGPWKMVVGGGAELSCAPSGGHGGQRGAQGER